MNASVGYRTVFDLHEKGFTWWFPAFGLIFLFVGAILIWLGKRKRWSLSRRWTGYFVVIFAAFWTISAFVGTYSNYSKIRDAYENGQSSTVEGPVTNFRPMPYEGHQDECFSVLSESFCYSDFDVSPGFNNSASHGGPIREGLPVRVSYVGNTIVRLQVREDALSSLDERKPFSESAKSDWQRRVDSDPIIRSISLGFAIGAVFMTLWWNVQWQRFMKFWLKPPYKATTIKIFRIFFAANLIGAVWYLAQQILRYRQLMSSIWTVIEIAALAVVIIWIMVNAVEWANRGRA